MHATWYRGCETLQGRYEKEAGVQVGSQTNC